MKPALAHLFIFYSYRAQFVRLSVALLQRLDRLGQPSFGAVLFLLYLVQLLLHLLQLRRRVLRLKIPIRRRQS